MLGQLKTLISAPKLELNSPQRWHILEYILLDAVKATQKTPLESVDQSELSSFGVTVQNVRRLMHRYISQPRDKQPEGEDKPRRAEKR